MDEIDTQKSVSKSAAHFITGTFISRFTGMIRDLCMAYFYGTSPAVAAFLIAFRLSNLLRRLLGEGALLNGFIPFFEAKRKESPKRAAEFFRDLFWSLSIIVILILIGAEILLVTFLIFSDISPGAREIMQMTAVMLPGIFFICQFGLSMALLECERNFFIPGVAPVAFNIVWIAAIFLFHNFSPFSAMLGISTSIVMAFFLQWWVTIPHVRNYIQQFLSWREWMTPHIFAPELKNMVSPLLFGVVGVAAMQINSAFDIIIARFASLEGPAYLSYAHRLQQLPLALFGIAIASALLPPFTRAVKEENHERFKSLLSFGLLRTYSLLFPGTIAIFVLGCASVNLLYGRGLFTNVSTIHTTLCLWGYGIGLVPAAFVLLLAPAYYARRDFWTPTLGSILSVLVNFVLNLLMVFVLHFGEMSIALCTSITAFINMQFLLKRLPIPIIQELLPTFKKITIASLTAGLCVLCMGYFYFHDPSFVIFFQKTEMHFPRLFLEQMQHFVVLTSLFALVFLISCYILKVEEVLQFVRIKRK
ncbi:MAG: murein biosynthesis integral membrane protein MurJ [Verrucomicrobia bacterium]|nr:murein biosynthesis integral membrane protein MurJ [Verrucomicrobiota bacterium]